MEKSNAAGNRTMLKKLLNKYAIYIIFVGMCVILSMLTPNFLKMRNILNVIRQVSVFGTIGLGVTLCIITAGTDLSAGSVAACAGVVSAIFAQRGGMNLILAIVLGILTGALAGLINGVLIVKGEIPPFIATLGMMSAARGAALLISKGLPISNLDAAYIVTGQGDILGIPGPIIIFAILAVIMHVTLSKTKFGRSVYAVGGNPLAAVTCGINKNKILIEVYLLEGVMCGIAGIILTSRVGSGVPTAALNYEFDAITGAIIGGTSFNGGIGTVMGTVVGVLVIGVLNNGMDLLAISSYWQQVVKGVVIVLAVVLDARKNKVFLGK
nr:ABC transporter permease [uncultured Oscillibacter sp.]